MKTLIAGSALLAAMLLSNVVGAGVYLVLWPIAAEISGDDAYTIVAAGVVGITAIGAAVAFLVGALNMAARIR